MDKTYDSNTISFERGSRGEWGPHSPREPLSREILFSSVSSLTQLFKVRDPQSQGCWGRSRSTLSSQRSCALTPISLNMITPNDVTKWFLSATPFTKCPDAAAQPKTIKQPQGQQSYTCWSPCSVGSQVCWNIGWQLREWTNRRLYIIYWVFLCTINGIGKTMFWFEYTHVSIWLQMAWPRKVTHNFQ